MATQRIYLVGTPDGQRRLIKATHRQRAITHVANSMLACRVATQDDLVDCLQSGAEVEHYGGPDQYDLVEASESPAN